MLFKNKLNPVFNHLYQKNCLVDSEIEGHGSDMGDIILGKGEFFILLVSPFLSMISSKIYVTHYCILANCFKMVNTGSLFLLYIGIL